MKIIKNNLALEQDGIIDLKPNPDNFIENDKQVEISINMGPADNSPVTELMEEIEENDIKVNNLEEDNQIINSDLSTESKKLVLEHIFRKNEWDGITNTNNDQILNNEILSFKDMTNDKIFTTIVNDMKNMSSIFEASIDILKNREEEHDAVVRRLESCTLKPESFKDYDLTEIMSKIGTIRKFTVNTSFQSLLNSLLFVLEKANIELTQEDDKIITNIANSKDIEKVQEATKLLKKKMDEDKYTNELNKRTKDQHSFFCKILDYEVIEYIDIKNGYIVRSEQFENNDVEYQLREDMNNITTTLNVALNLLKNFNTKTIEDLKIYNKKYFNICENIKAGIASLQNPTDNEIGVLHEALMAARAYYISACNRRLGDKLLAHRMILKLISMIINPC